MIRQPSPSAVVVAANDNEPRKGDWIQTFTGDAMWPMDPRVDEIRIEDIAHSLSMLCRFGGHCLRFYSVAEHSVLLSMVVAPEHAMWALLHDASEAYLTDVPRPVKAYLPGYKEAERHLQSVIAARFGLPGEIPEDVHEADSRIIADEARQNMSAPKNEWGFMPEALGVRLRFWVPDRAEEKFMERYMQLRSVA